MRDLGAESVRNYKVRLIVGNRTYEVLASSAESAKEVVLNVEPNYNEDWGIEIK